ncbi:MAG: S9 family peptidase, partial [Gammaproteobacteria bacterium]|nr:S9 family peptidase [Gammaproteobacteria bacterium]
MRKFLTGLCLLLLAGSVAAAEVERRTANDGQLIMEDIPPIPESLPATLSRYQSIRSARFAGWTKNSKNIFIKTRFGLVTQLHRVNKPAGARFQLTFGDEPVGEVLRQPSSNMLAMTRDEGGDEFDQIYLLNPEDGLIQLLSDGTALNNRMAWDRQGKRLAYRSTRRNGRSNDVWMQDVDSPQSARIVVESKDGTLWKPVDFSRDGRMLLIQQFISVADSRIYIKDLRSDEMRLLAGDAENPASNIATGFDRKDETVLFVTNQREGAAELAKVNLSG